MTKTKKPKPFTVDTPAHKVVSKIQELEAELKGLPRGPENADFLNLFRIRKGIKDELNILYRLRKKQKNYIPPPRRINLKKGL